jgi:signal transduction histidine kinase
MTTRAETGTSLRSVAIRARYFTALAAIACLVPTLLLTALPQQEVYGNRSLHVALETVAAFVLLLVASVLFGRYRLSGSGRDLFALLAVMVLAANNLFLSVLTSIVTAHPSAFTTWASHLAGVLGAIMFAVAALAPATPVRRRTKVLAAAGTGAILIGIVTVTGIFAGELPGQFASPPTDRESLERFHQQPVLTVLESLAALCFAIAAFAFARHADRERDPLQMWLGIFAIMASVAFINFALVPTLYTELLYAGDILLLVADLLLLLGTILEIGVYQASVTQAAVLDERRRVARDLHDGVAQELAFISSQMRWIVKQDPEKRAVDQIMDSVERALDESRAAISALSRPGDESLHVALANAAADIGTRVGARLELDLDERVDLPAPWREALVRITREAVANAVRHGRARTVSIQLRDTDGVWLRVTDDGEGFDPTDVRPGSGYGLTSMRERTETLGGQFTVSSVPGEGTCVEVQLP